MTKEKVVIHTNRAFLLTNVSEILVTPVALSYITNCSVELGQSKQNWLALNLPSFTTNFQGKLPQVNLHVSLVKGSFSRKIYLVRDGMNSSKEPERSDGNNNINLGMMRHHHPHLHSLGNANTEGFSDYVMLKQWALVESANPFDYLTRHVLPYLSTENYRTLSYATIHHLNVNTTSANIKIQLPFDEENSSLRVILVWNMLLDNKSLLLGFSQCSESVILPPMAEQDVVLLFDFWMFALAGGCVIILVLVICLFAYLHCRQRKAKNILPNVSGCAATMRPLLSTNQLAEKGTLEETVFHSRASLHQSRLINSSAYSRSFSKFGTQLQELKNCWLNQPRAEIEKQLMDEFVSLPIGFVYNTFVATLPDNFHYNRSNYVIPYDRNRINLPVSPNPRMLPYHTSSYINASMVSNTRGNSFIVTQVPMSSCQDQFWLMIWNANASTIVLLTDLMDNFRMRLACFWPKKLNKTALYGVISITLMETKTKAHRHCYVLVLTSAKCSEEKHVVFLWQFTSWLSCGIPAYMFPFLEFVKEIRLDVLESITCVMCATGGGRSGLYIALDSLLDESYESNCVNVFRIVAHLRRERPNLVRTKAQYAFLYHAVIEHFVSMGKDVRINTIFNDERNIFEEYKELVESFQLLLPSMPSNFSLLSFSQLPSSSFLPQQATAGNYSLPVMTSTPRGRISKELANGKISDFIANRMDTFHQGQNLLMFNSQVEASSELFWKKIHDNEVTVLINIDRDGLVGNETDVLTEQGSDHLHWKSLSIERFSTYCFESFSYRDIRLHISSKTTDRKSKHLLRHYVFKCWLSSEESLPSPNHVFALLKSAIEWYKSQGRSKPIAVYSARSEARATLFCLLWNLLERVIAGEQTIDLFNLVRHMYAAAKVVLIEVS